MKFHCVFKLRNLSDETVTLPVGFPVSAGALHFPENRRSAADSIAEIAPE